VQPRWDALLGGDPEQIERSLDEWVDGVRQRADRMREIRTRVEAIQITETSSNGAVTVTIDANGLPTDIRFTERALSVQPAELGPLVMSTLRMAHGRIAEQVRDAATAVVGGDLPETREMLVDSYRTRFGESGRSAQRPRQATHDDHFGDESYLG